MKRTIHFMIGPPGCGKTTLSIGLVRGNPNSATVHLDGFRAAIAGSKRAFWDNPTPERKGLVDWLYDRTLVRLLWDTDFDIILPNTNLDQLRHDRLYSRINEMTRARREQIHIQHHIFDAVPLKDLLEINMRRGPDDQLEPSVVVDYYNRMHAPDAYWRTLI